MANILTKSITASSLKAKSSGILSVFYKTIDKLALEKEELMQVAQENEAIVSKLSKLLTNELE